MRTIFTAWLLVVSFLPLHAHDVVWWDNFETGDPKTPLLFELSGRDIEDLIVDYPVREYVGVIPTYMELCTVEVNLDPIHSEFITAKVLAPNPAVWVEIAVEVLRVPLPGQVIETKISGEWHATKESGCTAILPNRFEVPITITVAPPWTFEWFFGAGGAQRFLRLNTLSKVGLQCSMKVEGPWWNIGIGNQFDITPEGPYKFFRGIQKQGGDVVGSFTDSMGVPLSEFHFGLPLGGASGKTSLSGGITLKGLPFGNNLLELSRSVSYSDPVTQAPRTEKATLEIEAPTLDAHGTLNMKVEAQVFPLPNCQCTPWCAIGFGTYNDQSTPIYFAGGAHAPKSGNADCGAPEVTVTGPDGNAFAIAAGTGKHQSSSNPASGLWTVTTKICGQTKSCSVRVP